MTIRSLINKKKRKIFVIVYCGLGIFVAGALFSISYDTSLIPGLLGFAVAFIAMIYSFFGISCPKCKEPWGTMAVSSGGPFSISKRTKFCPFCGRELDAQFEENA